jgi:hypothetical protein
MLRPAAFTDILMPLPPKSSVDLLQDPRFNKGTAFTAAERDALGLRGLLPPRVFTIEEQLERVMENFRAKDSAIERYIFMVALQDRNETLFYRTLLDHLPEMMPIIYTRLWGRRANGSATSFGGRAGYTSRPTTEDEWRRCSATGRNETSGSSS